MKNVKQLIMLFLLPTFVFANPVEDKIHRYEWGNIDVVWFEDERFPTYDLAIYFADGSLSESGDNHGVTEMMLNLLDAGTRRFSQKEISENLEYFGVSIDSSVTHEFSSVAFSGLIKDLVPTAKKVCHLFDDATFPIEEINKYKKAKIDGLRSLEGNPAGLTERIFRELSLSGSPYSYPVSGKINDISKISREELQNQHTYFNKSVKKRIYITGPKDVLNTKDIFMNECGWNLESSSFQRSNTYKVTQEDTSPRIFLVPVKQSNQAQVRVGRFLTQAEIQRPETLKLSSLFLGGGFTSVLTKELRVKRGLTYTASAYAGGQKNYGRAVISTFTKNQTVKELLEVTRNSLEQVGKGAFSQADLESARGLLLGREPFTYEESSAFLNYLMYFDHIDRDLDELFDFTKIVKKVSAKDVAESVAEIYNWNQQVIVVLGDKSLEKDLASLGKVAVVNVNDFL